MRIVDWLVIHTAGAFNAKTGKVVHQNVKQIDAYHREHNGWRMIGYHWYIEQDGQAMLGRLESDVGAHAGGFNEHSIGICCSGAGDYVPFNPRQVDSLVTLLARLCRTYHLTSDRVIGHRETQDHGGPPVYKTCPGLMVDMDELRQRVADRLETSG